MSNSGGRYFPHGGGTRDTYAAWYTDAVDNAKLISSHGNGGGVDMYEKRLRDEMAIGALSTMTFITKPYDTTESVADSCYKMADAMLARRKK